MASERFIGQALLESDFVNPNFFYLLSKEDKKALRSCCMKIPPTALFEQGFAKALFTTEVLKGAPISSGEVKKKVGRDIDTQDVYDVMTKGVQDKAVCAVLIFASPKSNSNELTNVRFMDKEEVRHFLFHELEKPKCLMQRFVMPKGNNNSVVLVTWSPLIVLTEGRRSTYSLLDRHVPPNLRGMTFEDASIPTLEVAMSDNVVQEITRCCATIAQHFDRTERLVLNRMTAMFKVDNNNNVVLLYSTSLRFHDTVTVSQPVSIEAGVHVAELKQKSLTQRFQGLGGKHSRDSQDPLEWMGVALAAADEREQKMRISIPAVGNTSAMLFEEVCGRRHASPSAKKNRGAASRHGSMRGSPSVASLSGSMNGSPTRASAQSSEQFPNPSSQRHAGEDPNKSASLTASHQQRHAGSSFTPASTLGASPAGGRRGEAPSSSFEGQYITVAPGAPLPQPRSLLKYQHVLPNSVNNMTTQVQLHALNANEETIRAEWDTFLAQQIRDIRHVRIAQAGQRLQAASVSGEGADGGGAAGSPQDADASRFGSKAPPPPKHHAKIGHSASGALSGEETLVGEETDVAKLAAQSQATLKAAQDKAAQREKATFMEEMRNEVARQALQGKRGGSKGGAGSASLLSAAATDGGNDDPTLDDDGPLEDDPRFHYVPRDTRTPLSIPDGIGVMRSTLLPPVFAAGALPGAFAVGGGGAGSKSRLAAPVPQSRVAAKANATKTAASKNLPAPSSPLVAGDSSASFVTKAAKDVRKTVVVPTPTLGVSLSPTSALNISGADKGVRSADGPVSPHNSSKLASSAKLLGATPSKRSVLSSSMIEAASTGGVVKMEPSSTRSDWASPTAAQHSSAPRDYIQQHLSAHAHVAHVFDDFGAMDLDDRAIVYERAQQTCQLFVTFIQDLHYAIHGAFLNRALGSVAYVELPVQFRDIVSMNTVAHILHKLHGKLTRRSEFLMESPVSPAHLQPERAEEEALKWRQELLRSLTNVALGDVFEFERIASWSDLQQVEASGGDGGWCFVVPLLDCAVGLAILREESFYIEADVKHYVDQNSGVVYSNALRHCYYARLAEIKGEQAAMQERLHRAQQEAAAAAEDEEHHRLDNVRSRLSFDQTGNDDDLEDSRPSVATRAATNASFDSHASPYQRSAGSPVGGVRQLSRKKSTAGAEESGDVAAAKAPLSEGERLQQKMNDMMCPKCGTCRVCCVCSLVAASSPLRGRR